MPNVMKVAWKEF